MTMPDAGGLVTTAQLGEQGQMILRKDFRAAQQLAPGDFITMIQCGNQLLPIPEKARFVELSNSLAARLEQAGISEESLVAGLKGARLEVARQHYLELFSASPEKESLE